jgi:hypothetical protein
MAGFQIPGRTSYAQQLPSNFGRSSPFGYPASTYANPTAGNPTINPAVAARATGATNLTGNPSNMNTYPASILQQAQDYDSIMKQYQDVANPGNDPQLSNLQRMYESYGSSPSMIAAPQQIAAPTYNAPEQIAGSPGVTAVQTQYQRSPEMKSASDTLSELSATGGYSDAGIRDLRARGISPIRAVYANAMQNITRQKALQGGYSPNYTAAMAKMGRDLSEQIAGATQNVNAGIAQNVASNRLSAAPQFAQFAQNETGAMNDIASRNAAAVNAASTTNASLAADTSARNAAAINDAKARYEASINDVNARNASSVNDVNSKNAELSAGARTTALSGLSSLYGASSQKQLSGIEGMKSLYGTTPALSSLYGSQALNAAQLAEQEKTRKQQGQLGMINAYTSGMKF